jgi:hypothetical protein
MVTQPPPPVTPATTTISCSTSKVPALVDAIIAVNFLLGIGVTAYRADSEGWSSSDVQTAAAVGLGLTILLLASANTGVTRADACYDSKEKLQRMLIRQAQQRSMHAQQPPPPAPDVFAPSVALPTPSPDGGQD